jgi:cellulose synthase/poly-beta-1,6-N-acetylglucosamine synthase-like glycosyltransferase
MNKPTVTIAVSALNEEANIKRFLESVVHQEEDDFVITKILIISDGSEDKTVEIAKSFYVKTIEVREYAERKGKSYRINEIIGGLTSDIMVQFDADVVLEHDRVIHDLIQPLIHQESVGMCGGNPLPFLPETFTEKAIVCSLDSYLPLRSKLKGGNNVYSALGCMLAFRTQFIKKVTIPNDAVVDDLFLYFSCLSLGYTYAYAPTAIVRYRLPQTLRDHVKQNTRFASGPLKMKEYFSSDLVDSELHIPTYLKLRYRIEQVLKHPILSMYIYIVNKYCHYKAARTWRGAHSKWDLVQSTKS